MRRLGKILMKEDKHMRCFFDSNIIINAFKNVDENVEAERELLYDATIGKIEGVISAKQMTDIYYVLRKYVREDFRRREVISILLDSLEVVPVDKELLNSCLWSHVSESDYEDNIIIECAKRTNVDLIVTNDQNGFVYSEIETKTAKEALEMLNI